MTKSQVCLGLTCLSFGIFACESEPELLEISSAEAALTASENTERALSGVIDAAEFLAGSASIAQSLSVFGRSETCETTGAFCGAGVDCPAPETVCTTDEVSEADLEQARQDARESAQALVQRLREEIFIEANLETETSTSATYRLGPDVLCAEDAAADAGLAAPEPTLEPDCAERVEQLEPRLVLTSPRAGDIDVQLLLGAERHAPLSLQLYQRRVGMRVDLGEGLAVARELGEDLGAIRELAGVLELRLLQNAALDYSLELNVLEAIEVEAESDGEPVSVSLGASSPAWNVRVNGNDDTLSAGIDLGAFRLAGPLRAYAALFGASADEPRDQTGMLELFLGGLSGDVSYTANSDVLSFTNVGYGDQTSTLKHDGNTLLSLDFNATQGRRVNFTVTPSEDGARIEIEPSLELRLELAFQHVADQFEGLADHLLDETLRIWFEGESPSVDTGGGQLRVTSGTLHVESRAEPSLNVSVAAGMCLASTPEEEEEDGTIDAEASVSAETGEPEPHPLLELEATTCE